MPDEYTSALDVMRAMERLPPKTVYYWIYITIFDLAILVILSIGGWRSDNMTIK